MHRTALAFGSAHCFECVLPQQVLDSGFATASAGFQDSLFQIWNLSLIIVEEIERSRRSQSFSSVCRFRWGQRVPQSGALEVLNLQSHCRQRCTRIDVYMMPWRLSTKITLGEFLVCLHSRLSPQRLGKLFQKSSSHRRSAFTTRFRVLLTAS